MKFRIENRSARIYLGQKPGEAREYSADEFEAKASAVVMSMSATAQWLKPAQDAEGQSVSVPTMRPAKSGIHVFVVEDGEKDQELSAADVKDLFSKQLAARAAERQAAHKERLASRRKMFTR